MHTPQSRRWFPEPVWHLFISYVVVHQFVKLVWGVCLVCHFVSPSSPSVSICYNVAQEHARFDKKLESVHQIKDSERDRFVKRLTEGHSGMDLVSLYLIEVVILVAFTAHL